MMIGLVNVVRTCACAPAKGGGWGILGAALGVLVVFALVASGGGALLTLVGGQADSVEAAERTVAAAFGTVGWFLTGAVGLVVLALVSWGAWSIVDYFRGRRVEADFLARNPAVLAARSASRVPAGQRRQAIDRPLQRVTSERVDRLEAPARPTSSGKSRPLIGLDELAERGRS